MRCRVFAGSAADDGLPAKVLSYNRANRAVAILCNHQRAPPKTFERSMRNLQTKVSRPGPGRGPTLRRWRELWNQRVNAVASSLLRCQIDEKQEQLSAARKQLKAAKARHKASGEDKSKK